MTALRLRAADGKFGSICKKSKIGGVCSLKPTKPLVSHFLTKSPAFFHAIASSVGRRLAIAASNPAYTDTFWSNFLIAVLWNSLSKISDTPASSNTACRWNHSLDAAMYSLHKQVKLWTKRIAFQYFLQPPFHIAMRAQPCVLGCICTIAAVDAHAHSALGACVARVKNKAQFGGADAAASVQGGRLAAASVDIIGNVINGSGQTGTVAMLHSALVCANCWKKNAKTVIYAYSIRAFHFRPFALWHLP